MGRRQDGRVQSGDAKRVPSGSQAPTKLKPFAPAELSRGSEQRRSLFQPLETSDGWEATEASSSVLLAPLVDPGVQSAGLAHLPFDFGRLGLTTDAGDSTQKGATLLGSSAWSREHFAFSELNSLGLRVQRGR